LEKASMGFEPGAIIIDHTTTSAEGAAARTKRWKERGYTYLHAPVFMGPQNALESTGVMLVSGDAALIAKLEPELSAMTGKLVNLGTTVNRAAGLKLAGNLFLISLTAGIADTLVLAKALDIPATEITRLFDFWNPVATAPARVKKITADDFSNPSWELSMARKDARLMMEEVQHAGKTLTVIPAVAGLMDRWIARGHGNEDWAIIGRDAGA
jgi:3-hydroxyisobutyrate dehydrogenase